MAGLLDIAPSFSKVSIRGTEVEVGGISASGFAVLLDRFPEIRKLMSGMSIDASDIFRLAGDAIAPIIAAGTGSPGDEQTEAVAASLSLEEQADLLEAIIEKTFPKGVGPFVDRLTGMFSGLSGEVSQKAQATKLRKQ